jgi:hypothetical protein
LSAQTTLSKKAALALGHVIASAVPWVINRGISMVPSSAAIILAPVSISEAAERLIFPLTEESTSL